MTAWITSPWWQCDGSSEGGFSKAELFTQAHRTTTHHTCSEIMMNSRAGGSDFVGPKRQKWFLPPYFPGFFLSFSHRPNHNCVCKLWSAAWPIHKGRLTCISAQHANITALLPSVCSAVSTHFCITGSSMLCTVIFCNQALTCWPTFREDHGGPQPWNTWELVQTLNLRPLDAVKFRPAHVSPN